jgi:four helix bundle protein
MMETNEPRRQVKKFQDLVAWQKARCLVKVVYEASRKMPREEVYGLTNQIRRAAVSVPSNIAEGYGRGSLNDYIRFLLTARGSLYELQTQLLLGGDLEYIAATQVDALIQQSDEVSRVLQGLISSLTRLKE